MAVTDALAAARGRLGSVETSFECCDTDFLVSASGYRADAAVSRATETARALEARLNAFDPESAVSRLNRTGEVADEHVAHLVRRGLEYEERTGGVFAIQYGEVEHDLKAYIRGDRPAPPETFDAGTVSVDGDHVTASNTLDLNGLAKGYIVERATDELRGFGRIGFVSGGGDMTPPTGPVEVADPGGGRALRVLDTDWNVATSGNYRRTRDGTDHIYDPRTARVGARQESVTVLAERDCTEADALATTLAALDLDAALELAESWSGAEAFVVRDGVFHETEGFENHVLDD